MSSPTIHSVAPARPSSATRRAQPDRAAGPDLGSAPGRGSKPESAAEPVRGSAPRRRPVPVSAMQPCGPAGPDGRSDPGRRAEVHVRACPFRSARGSRASLRRPSSSVLRLSTPSTRSREQGSVSISRDLGRSVTRKSIRRKDEPRFAGWISHIITKRGSGDRPGGDLLSHSLTRAVPSALEGLTSEFGMGSGMAPPTLPPEDLEAWCPRARFRSHAADVGCEAG